MAMTKKERAEFDAAIAKAKLLAALRWTSIVQKDVPKPVEYGESSEGFDFNSDAARIDHQWSEYIRHGDMPKTNRTAYQEGKRLFSTRLLALRAMRHEVEIECARKLLNIDKQIEVEQAKDPQ